MDKAQQISVISTLSLLLLFGSSGAPAANGITPLAKNFAAKCTSCTTDSDDAAIIEPGDALKIEVKRSGQVNVFQINMNSGTSVEIKILDRTASLDLTLVSGGADPRADMARKTLGRTLLSQAGVVEPIVLTAESPGAYLIRVAGRSTGSYTISTGAVHNTEERDRKYSEANRLMDGIRRSYEATTMLSEVGTDVEKRVSIYRELGSKEGLALALVDAGSLNKYDVEKNLPMLLEAQQIFQSLDSYPDLMYVLGAKRLLFELRGYYQEAIATQNELLQLCRNHRRVEDEASGLITLGVIYHRLADGEKAKEYYDKAFQIAQSIVPASRRTLGIQSLYFTNLANLARGMNGGEVPIEFFAPPTDADRKQAIVYAQRSLEIQKAIEKQYPGTANMLTFNILQIANTYYELASYADALKYLDTLQSIASPEDAALKARVLLTRGRVLAKMHDIPGAVDNFDQGISNVRAGAGAPGFRAGYFQVIGREYLEMGDLRRSEDAFSESLEISRRFGQARETSSALLGIARVQRELGNFNNAKNAIEEAIQLEEALRARITDDELRTTYFFGIKRLYDFYVDLLMQSRKSQPEKGYDALALESSEKSRSRILLDLLAISRVNLTAGVPPELLASEKAAKIRLISKANEQNRLLIGRHSDADLARLRSEINDLTEKYSAIESDIREASPRYAALTQPTALDASGIRKMLDSGTVLLEYALGDKKSYLWLISAESISSFDLPARDQIEAKARKIYESITARNAPSNGSVPEHTRARLAAADAEYTAASLDLSQMLLGPAGDLLKDKRLVVVPDGALNYISFAALPLPTPVPSSTTASTRKGQDRATLTSVGSLHEVVTLPSASTLARLRDETEERRPSKKLVAIFADPVFGSEDGRVDAVSKKASLKKTDLHASAATRDFERAVADVGLVGSEKVGLARLPFSRREANAIFDASPKGLSRKSVDFNASKQQVLSSGLDQYRILHFATHGLLDSQHPELSGVVLSLVDEGGQDVDGFLRLQDIYSLDLNADLVVLSACNTALGRDVRGEGLIGLTRGFMYAGTPRVIASLWKVDDAATAELMSIFYKKMLVEQNRPAAALRAAQMEMQKQPRWRSPYYWAPFVLQGEWK